MTGEGAMVEIRPQVFAFEEQCGAYRHRFEAPTIADLVALRAAFEAAKVKAALAAIEKTYTGPADPEKRGRVVDVTRVESGGGFDPLITAADIDAAIADLRARMDADTPTVVEG